MQKELELGFSGGDQEFESEDSLSVTDWMGRKVRFRSNIHREAYSRLTPRQRQYIASYMASESRQQIAKELGLNGSLETIGKTLASIAKKMGLNLLDLRDPIKPNHHSTTAASLKQLIEKQEFRCALSGEAITPEVSELDHKKAVSNGGDHNIENLQWLHCEVNRMKGSLSQERFVELCRKGASWNR